MTINGPNEQPVTPGMIAVEVMMSFTSKVSQSEGTDSDNEQWMQKARAALTSGMHFTLQRETSSNVKAVQKLEGQPRMQ